MDISAIKTAIYQWAAANADGATVYWDNPAAPRPAGAAVRLKLIGPLVLGIDELRNVEGDPDAFAIVGPRQMMLSVNAYGDTAMQILADLQTSLRDPASQATLASGGVSSLSTSGVRDLSQLLETLYEQRFQMDVTLLAMEDKTVQPGRIEHVQVAGAAGVQDFSLTVDKTP